MKKSIILFLGVYSVLLTQEKTFAQTPLLDAIKLTESEQFEKAAAQYVSLIEKEPTNGENYFHLGENYFKQALLDSTFKPVDLDSASYGYTNGK